MLLALLGDDDSVGARALKSFAVNGERLREAVSRHVPVGSHAPTGQPMPFTPRAKKALELALREALSLGHNYIGSEHVLLGLAATDDCQAANVLRDLGVEPEAIRVAVISELSGSGAPPPQLRHRALKRLAGRRVGPGVSELEGGFRVVPNSEVVSLLMRAAAHALEEGRTVITIDDVKTALDRWDTGREPPQAAAGP